MSFADIQSMKALKTINSLINGSPVNLLNSASQVAPNIVDNKYVSTTGAQSSNTNFYISSAINVDPSKMYTIKQLTPTITVVGAWYDVNGSWISTITTDGSKTQLSVVPPINAKFIRLNVQKSTQILELWVNTGIFDGMPINIIKPALQVAPNIIDNNYVNGTGGLSTNTSYFISSITEVTPNASYLINKVPSGALLLGAWYDINGAWISTISGDGNTPHKEVVAPANARTIRLNMQKNNPLMEMNTFKMSSNSSGSGTSNTKKYFDKQFMQTQLKDFLFKLMNKQTVNILAIGDSVTNFQNSGTLAIADQKTAPVGLAGENWLRRIWKDINYNVWNDKRDTIVNVNGNMGFKRYDHTDFVFSNGYSGTTSLGTSDWGTNRSDAESWRNNDFNGSATNTTDRVLSSESSYNIPMVGTIKSGATVSVSIPSTAIGCRVILGKNKISSASTSATITITGGTTQSLNPSTFATYQNYFDFTLTSGTAKTLALTNNAAGELWIWGIEYWTDTFVRVLNLGLAGNSSNDINSKWSLIPKSNIDLVIVETPALNDATLLTYTQSIAQIDTLFSNIKALNVPILPILVHRTTAANGLLYDRNNDAIGTKFFVPNYIKQYKSVLAKDGLGYIDMWQKSIDDVGSLADAAPFPTNYLVDWGHPGVLLNQSYEDELKKVFLWDDIS